MLYLTYNSGSEENGFVRSFGSFNWHLLTKYPYEGDHYDFWVGTIPIKVEKKD